MIFKCNVSGGCKFLKDDEAVVPKNNIHIAVSDAEWELHQIWPFCRFLFKHRYPVNLHSQQPITEFVLLADYCAKLGASVVPSSQIEELLREGIPVVKFGQTNLAEDLALLTRFPNLNSEWNRKNLELVGEFNRYLNLGRKTWNVFLGISEHHQLLQDLFRRYGKLFIKTRTKGFSKIYHSYSECLKEWGDIDSLAEESRDLIVSEVIEIAQIDAVLPDGPGVHNDEWRHYVYQQRLICSLHAFDCDSSCTDNSSRRANIQKAQSVINELKDLEFATTYVLDTCTLSDGEVVVVEANNFFSSGMFDKKAILEIARAVVSIE